VTRIPIRIGCDARYSIPQSPQTVIKHRGSVSANPIQSAVAPASVVTPVNGRPDRRSRFRTRRQYIVNTR
jgi:hypothetical protein